MSQDLHAYEQMRAQIMRAVAAEKLLDEIQAIVDLRWSDARTVYEIRKVLEQR